jgi:predicted LPLAT superfamily acyltransferase
MDEEKKNEINNWDSRSIGKRWQHRFFYILIRFAGRRIAYLFMYFVALWYVFFYPPLHKKCRPYLSRRFPDKKKKFTIMLNEYRWITSLGKTLIDRAAFGILGSKSLEIEVPQGPQLQELLNEGKGVIILSAHTACWQIAFSALKLSGMVYIVMHRAQRDIDKHYFEHDGNKPPFEIIDPSDYLGGTLQMASVLQDGHVVGLMGDRVFGDDNNTITVDFLGDAIEIPVAPYRLAAMQGTPIAILFSHKVNGSRYRIEMPGIIRIPAGINRNPNAYLPYAQEFVGYLTEYVQKHPFDFHNFFQMWKSQLSETS